MQARSFVSVIAGATTERTGFRVDLDVGGCGKASAKIAVVMDGALLARRLCAMPAKSTESETSEPLAPSRDAKPTLTTPRG